MDPHLEKFGTERPIIDRKSILRLLKYRFVEFLSRGSTVFAVNFGPLRNINVDRLDRGLFIKGKRGKSGFIYEGGWGGGVTKKMLAIIPQYYFVLPQKICLRL